jgi:hypothetical protein
MLNRKFQLSCLAIAAFVAAAPVANADMTCRISMNITKGGFVIGAAGGSGTLNCGGRRYPIEVGGINAGLIIGVSKMSLRGKARYLRDVSDIEGTYAKTGASAAAGSGGTNLLARNEKGVELAMTGSQVGLEASLDLGGLTIRLAN